MTAPVIWCPPGARWPRWHEAWPDACVLAPGEPAPMADLHWVSTDCTDWPELVRELATPPSARAVVVLSGQPGAAQALQAIEAGARGYCHALATPQMLRDVALVVGHGGLWVGPELLTRVMAAVRPAASLAAAAAPALPLERLSAREREVAGLVGEGLSNKEIARRLDVTERTVKAHVSAAFDKLGVRDRLQLAIGMTAGARGSAGEGTRPPDAGGLSLRPMATDAAAP